MLNQFYDDVLKGNQIKEIVKVILEKSGYSVYPYGYESTLLNIKKKLREEGTRNSKTVRRIRSSPDLLVYDPFRKDLVLIEVRMRKAKKQTAIRYLKINWCKEFWDDSAIVLVVPFGNVFYAQNIHDLESKERYNIDSDFKTIQDFFPQINPETVNHYKTEALTIMGIVN